MRVQQRRRSDRKKTSQDGEGGAPGWMVTYGDLMSLLLCFFVLIVSFSSIQLSEFQKAMGSLKGALGVLKFRQSTVQLSNLPNPEVMGFQHTDMGNRISELAQFIEQQGLTDSIQIRLTDTGIAIRLLNPILFDLGKADLKPRVFPILDKIIAIVKTGDTKVRIEGHTDNLPIHTPQFPSNWELSAMRAINVLHYFENVGKVPPQRLSYMGYGEYKPIVPNDSEENRAKNRRVEIYIDTVEKTEETEQLENVF
ncbi:flagellar motor protein MotB [bacterium]|nr:flagellar motor protein MotB [bacterium]